MNIADSNLFKDFARPILRPDTNRVETRSGPLGSTFGIMNSAVQFFLDRSKITLEKLDITHPTKDSFYISVESRLTNTGPIGVTVSPMTVDLTFNGSQFGKLDLDELTTSFWGSKVIVKDQKILITDMTTYQSFVRSIIVDDDTLLRIENGECNIKTMGKTVAHSNYNADLGMRAMALQAKLLKLELLDDGTTIVTTMEMDNPSPVELDMGTSVFELRNDKGEVVVELRGELDIVRGRFQTTARGTKRAGVVPSKKLRLVGVGVESDSWCNEAVQHFDGPVELEDEFLALLK